MGIVLPETAERRTAVEGLVRRSDWEAVEAQAKAFLEYLQRTGEAPFEARRAALLEQPERLRALGATVPESIRPLLDAAASPAPEGDWVRSIPPAAKLDEAVRAIQNELSTSLRSRAGALAEWAGSDAAARSALDGKFRQALEPIRAGEYASALDRLGETARAELPSAVARREKAREVGRGIVAIASDLGASPEVLEAALRADADAAPLDWPTTVDAVERASAQMAESLRDRVVTAVDSLRATLDSLREYGVDTAGARVALDEVAAQIPGAAPSEIPALLQSARSVTEEPVVAVVASLLDGVRPRLVEARRLGRDASEVFAAMNRAREAMRLRIYSEALAASQEAMDRVTQLTGDLDSSREEAESLQRLLDRLAATRFPTGPHLERLHRAQELLERLELDAARTALQEAMRVLGNEAAQHFSEKIEAIAGVLTTAGDRGFLPAEADRELERVRSLLDDGQIADAGEQLAALEVRLRASAGPYLARRVEELEKGFTDIPDEALVAPVRRLLADTDVNLRVKEDLPASLESLKRAEREFAAIFAAHASSLVEMLDEERKVLESMGGTGDEIQRQIDEVQQIFNMGDFVKASRASQEIRARIHQQQLVRSEDEISHAKLALVELSKMGVEAGPMRQGLEEAQQAARDQKYAESYRRAYETLGSATRLKTQAQGILDGIQEASDLWQNLKAAGAAVEPYREKIRLIKAAYQSLDFDGAKEALEILQALLRSEQANAETRRLLGEADLLREDAQRLSMATEPVAATLAEARTALDEGRSAEALAKARAVHAEMIAQLRPVLSENLRALERDLEVAQAAGLDLASVAGPLGEARRRLALPVPTGVAELVESARTQLVETRGFLEHAERAVKRVREAQSQAELVRAPGADALRTKLREVETSLKRRDYARTIEIGGALERETLQLVYQQVSKTLAAFQGSVVRTRQEGGETAVAENLLMQARTALEEGRALEALQLVASSESELERAELQVRIAQGSLQAMEKRIAEAHREGIHAKVAEEEYAKARDAFGGRQFAEVLELAIDAADALRLTQENHRRSREALEIADRQVKEALEVGADVASVVKLLDSARNAQQASEYADAARRAREAAEAARWSVERLYTGVLAETRALLETARSESATEGLAPAEAAVEEAEGALKARDWRRATSLLTTARRRCVEALEGRLRSRIAEIEAIGGMAPGTSAAEATVRGEARARLDEEVGRGAFAAAFALLREEEGRLLERTRSELQAKVNGLKDRLWIGEKLGLDTTPVMERFSEAQIALTAGKIAPVRALVESGEAELVRLVGARLDEKLREVQTELVFAQDGLHVALGDVDERLHGVPATARAGRVLEAAEVVVSAAEELNRRKALHRELLNLHYLIDAALTRASERKIDTSEARKLLDESLRARATDYAVALAKARAALGLLQGQLKGVEPPAPFWPFRRPPSG